MTDGLPKHGMSLASDEQAAHNKQQAAHSAYTFTHEWLHASLQAKQCLCRFVTDNK